MLFCDLRAQLIYKYFIVMRIKLDVFQTVIYTRRYSIKSGIKQNNSIYIRITQTLGYTFFYSLDENAFKTKQR